MKKTLSLVMAVLLLCSLLVLPASAEGESFACVAAKTVDGTPVSDLTTLNTGDTVVVTVSLTRTDIDDGATYQAWGLEMIINSLGLNLVSSEGYRYGDSASIAPSTSSLGGATGTLNLSFMHHTSGPNTTFTLDKTVTVTATYTVADPAKAQAWAPNPYIYLAGSYDKTEVTNNCTITLDPGEGTLPAGASPTIATAVGETISLPAPNRAGYTFIGWSDVTRVFTDSYPVSGEKTLTAVWGGKITFNMGGSGLTAPESAVRENGATLDLTTPSWTGHSFDGWSDGSQTYTGTYTVNGDAALTAVWSELPSYTIRFVMSIPNAPATVAAPTPAAVNEITAMTGASVTLPTLTHRSYSFRGWSTSAERTNPVSSYTMGNEGVTLYAVWGTCVHNRAARTSTVETRYIHNDGTSTHIHRDTTTAICRDCGQAVGDPVVNNVNENCVGTVGNQWLSNSTQHWHYCTTEGAAFDAANHTYVNGVCSVCGYGTTTTGGTGGGEIGGTSVITRINGGTTTGTAIENPSGGTTTIVEEEVPLAGVDNLVLVTVNDPTIGATASGSRNEDGSIKITVKDVSGAEVLSIPGGVRAEIHGVTTGQVVVIVDTATGEILDLVEKSLVEGQVAYTLLDGSVTIRIIDNAKPFDDVMPYDWFNDSVIFASSHELFNGTAERIFEPNTPMSRGMLVTVLWRLENKPNDFSENVFSDVENGTWYTDPVRWATKNGIVKGYDDGTFRPNKEITREEMAAILYRYMDYLKYNVTGRNDLSAYTDASSVAQWALENVQWAVDAGIITGVTADTIQPQTTATRAQVATMFQRIVTGMVK